MYYPNKIEEVSYEPAHIQNVLNEIRTDFDNYFADYVETASVISSSGLL